MQSMADRVWQVACCSMSLTVSTSQSVGVELVGSRVSVSVVIICAALYVLVRVLNINRIINFFKIDYSFSISIFAVVEFVNT